MDIWLADKSQMSIIIYLFLIREIMTNRTYYPHFLPSLICLANRYDVILI